MTVVVHREASEEALAAALWYDDRRPGLGSEFLTALSDAIQSISKSPRALPIYGANERVRRLLLQRFPYAVVFAVRGKGVLVVAFAHARRRPGYWRRRLRRA